MAGFDGRGSAGRSGAGLVSGVVAIGFWVLLFSVVGNVLQGLPEVWRWVVGLLLVVAIPVVGYLLLIGITLLYGVVTGKRVDYR